MRACVSVLSLLTGVCVAWAPRRIGGWGVPGRGASLAQTQQRMGTRCRMVAVTEVSGTALVSGFLTSQERTDQFVFDTLHKHGVFEKIIAYSPDTAFSKKRLIGRATRYSGLLDVLDFVEGSTDQLLDSDGPLAGVNSWLSFDVDTSQLVAQAKAAKAAGVKNLVCVVTQDADFAAAEAELKGSEVSYTFIRTPPIVDGKEGQLFSVKGVSEAPIEGSTVARDDAIRIAAECFMIPVDNRSVAFSVVPGNDNTTAYIKELRASGVTRQEEIAAILSGGQEKFEAKLQAKADKKEEEKVPEKTPEERAAMLKEAEIANREYWQKFKDDQLKAEAERELNRDYIRVKYKNNLWGSKEAYFEDNMEAKLADLKNRTYFDDQGRLQLIRDESELDFLKQPKAEEGSDADADTDADKPDAESDAEPDAGASADAA